MNVCSKPRQKLNIQLNERLFETASKTLFELRDAVKPAADVVILNGAAMSADAPLKEGDEVCLIKRGEAPSADELEALMASRHTPGVHAKLKAATVGIAGLGGLGSAIAVSKPRRSVSPDSADLAPPSPSRWPASVSEN